MILFPDGPNFSTALIEAFDPSYFIETFPVLLSLSLVVGLCLISLVVNVGILASGICVPVPCLFCCLNSQVNSLHPNFKYPHSLCVSFGTHKKDSSYNQDLV